MANIEEQLRILIKGLSVERRLGDKRAEQFYDMIKAMDHGDLSGLGDDDHSQYYNSTRHTKAVHDALGLDHGSLAGKDDDDHAQYYNAARHTKAVHDALALDHGSLSGLGDNDHGAIYYTEAEINAALDLTNKVVKADVMCSAYLLSGTPTVNDSTLTKVTLNAETLDVGGDFDHVTNYRFTAPVTGYYFVSAGIRWNTLVAGKRYDMRVYKNGAGGSQVLWDRRESGATPYDCQPRHSDVIYLAATDYLELFAWHNDGTNNPVYTGTNSFSTYMTVRLVAT